MSESQGNTDDWPAEAAESVPVGLLWVYDLPWATCILPWCLTGSRLPEGQVGTKPMRLLQKLPWRQGNSTGLGGSPGSLVGGRTRNGVL